MVIGKILDLFDPGRPPNNFTVQMGELVRKARIDAGFNQRELANLTYSRQATISDIENGKKLVDSAELVALSGVLNKPILFFVPEKYRKIMNLDLKDPELNELLMVAKKLNHEDLRRLIIQARALVKHK